MTQKGGCHSWDDAGPPRLVPGYLFIGENDTPGRADFPVVGQALVAEQLAVRLAMAS